MLLSEIISQYLNIKCNSFVLGGVKIKIYIKGGENNLDGKTYLALQQMKMDFSVERIKMGVDGIHNQNSILRK